jgi:hypothetical protein
VEKNKMNMRKLLIAFFLIAAVTVPGVFTAIADTSKKPLIQEVDECPSPEAIAAQRLVIANIINEYLAVRAYKDATINELARLNVTYYSLRGGYFQALFEREDLLNERQEILADQPLSAEDIQRIIEIDDRVLELSILLQSINENLLQQLVLIQVYWVPVVNLIPGISVERYERFTQRILEVERGDGVTALTNATNVLNAMLACEGAPGVGVPGQPGEPGEPGDQPPGIPDPSGVGVP